MAMITAQLIMRRRVRRFPRFWRREWRTGPVGPALPVEFEVNGSGELANTERLRWDVWETGSVVRVEITDRSGRAIASAPIMPPGGKQVTTGDVIEFAPTALTYPLGHR